MKGVVVGGLRLGSGSWSGTGPLSLATEGEAGEGEEEEDTISYVSPKISLIVIPSDPPHRFR